MKLYHYYSVRECATCTSSKQRALLGSKTKRHVSCFQGSADASSEAICNGIHWTYNPALPRRRISQRIRQVSGGRLIQASKAGSPALLPALWWNHVWKWQDYPLFTRLPAIFTQNSPYIPCYVVSFCKSVLPPHEWSISDKFCYRKMRGMVARTFCVTVFALVIVTKA